MNKGKSVNERMLLFPGDLPEREWADFKAYGFSAPVSGLIYRSGNPPVCGMPLGGIDTGCIDLEVDGTFGYATIFDSHVPRRGPIGAPVFGINIDGATWVLSKQKARVNFPSLQVKGETGLKLPVEIHYWGHYPIADLEFVTDSPVSVGLRAWSPFIPGDVKNSNIPGAVFQMMVRNETDADHKVVAAMSFPGPSKEETKWNSEFQHLPTGQPICGILVSNPSGVEYVMGVLSPGVCRVGMPKVRFGGELGNAAGPWAMIGEELPFPLSNAPGFSVSQEVTLGPRECRELAFFLAWYSPTWQGGGSPMSGGNTYTHMYASRFKNALEAAEYLAHGHMNFLRRILAWQEVVYSQKPLPGWLKDSLINSLHLITETGMWAQARPPIGDWCKAEDGLFGMNECPRECPQIECLPCSFYGNFPLVFFFPELALSTLRGYKAYQYPDGTAPWIFGGCTGNTGPCEMTLPTPGYQVTLNGPCYVDMVDRMLLRTRGESILKEFYESIKKNTIFTMNLRPEDGAEGLVSMPSGNMGGEWFEACEWFGMTPHVGGIHLANLRMAERMAEAAGDREFAERCRRWFEEGSRAMEEKLWAGKYYLASFEPSTGRKSDIIFAYQLDGEWMARLHGLPSVFRRERVRTTLDTIKKTCVPATPYGAVNFLKADGSPVSEDEYHTGYGWALFFPPAVLILAMNYMYEDDVEFGLDLARRSMINVASRQGLFWNAPNLINGETGQAVYGSDYYQNMVIWALPIAMQKADLASAREPDSLVNKIIRAGR